MSWFDVGLIGIADGTFWTVSNSLSAAEDIPKRKSMKTKAID